MILKIGERQAISGGLITISSRNKIGFFCWLILKLFEQVDNVPHLTVRGEHKLKHGCLFVSSLFNLFWKPGPQSILGDRRPCSTHRRSNAFEVHRFCICTPPFLPSFEPETLSWIEYD